MKYIAGIIIGLVLGGVGVVYAYNPNEDYRDLGYFDTRGPAYQQVHARVIRFTDPDNGNTCYLAQNFREVSISCVK